MREYEPTGNTPEQSRYEFPTELPRTMPYDILIAGMHCDPVPSSSVGSVAVFSEVPEAPEPFHLRSRFPTLSSAQDRSPLGLQEESCNLFTTITLNPEASKNSLPAKNTTKTWVE